MLTLPTFAKQQPDDIFDNDHQVLVEWLLEIEEKLEDGEEVSSDDLAAYEQRPLCFAHSKFDSKCEITESMKIADVWRHVDPDNVASVLREMKLEAEQKILDDVMEKKYGSHPSWGRGVSFR